MSVSFPITRIIRTNIRNRHAGKILFFCIYFCIFPLSIEQRMCLGTFSRLRRSLATSTLYIAVCILAERFLLYRNAISCEVKKSPESHLWIQGIFSIPHSRQNVQLSKSVSKTPSGVFIVRIPRLKLSSETVI